MSFGWLPAAPLANFFRLIPSHKILFESAEISRLLHQSNRVSCKFTTHFSFLSFSLFSTLVFSLLTACYNIFALTVPLQIIYISLEPSAPIPHQIVGSFIVLPPPYMSLTDCLFLTNSFNHGLDAIAPAKRPYHWKSKILLTINYHHCYRSIITTTKNKGTIIWILSS